MTGAQTDQDEPEAVTVPLRSGGLMIVADDGTNPHIGQERDRLQTSERYIQCDNPVDLTVVE